MYNSLSLNLISDATLIKLCILESICFCLAPQRQKENIHTDVKYLRRCISFGTLITAAFERYRLDDDESNKNITKCAKIRVFNIGTLLN